MNSTASVLMRQDMAPNYTRLIQQLFLLLIFICTFTLNLASKSNQGHVDEVFELIDGGDASIDLLNGDNMTFLLGLSGSGKSTLMLFLAGNNSKLLARQIRFGGMVIDDVENEKISKDKLISKTLYPDSMIEPTSGEIFVDCPGFSDTRNESTDIVASYSIKRAFNKANNIKIVLVMSHSALVGNDDRYSLINLLDAVAHLVSDIDKFKLGLGLIITKSPNVESAAQYMREVEDALTDAKQQISKISSQKKNQKLLILDAILDKSNGLKFGFFRAPEKPGVLSESKVMQENKQALLEMITKNIKFVPKDDDDFQTSVSIASEKFIKDEILKELSNNIAALSNLEKQLLRQHLDNIGNVNINPKLFSEEIFEISKLFADMNDTNDKKIFQTIMISLTDYLVSVNITNRNVLNFDKKFEHYLFFQAVTKSTRWDLKEWLVPIMFIKRYVETIRDYYLFINDVILNLNQDFHHSEKSTKWSPEILSNSTLKSNKDVLYKFYSSGLVENATVWMELSNHNLESMPYFLVRDLAFLVQLASRDIKCLSEGAMDIRGHYLSLRGDVLWALDNHVCGQDVKSISVFALEKIFIDTSLRLELHLVLVAPEWSVSESPVVVDLSGSHGKNYSAAALSGVWEDEKGEDGLPGNSGIPGHNFIGFTAKIEHPNHLTVISNGGNGGQGQDGGNGYAGALGVAPELGGESWVYGSEKVLFEQMNIFNYKIQRINSTTQAVDDSCVYRFNTSIYYYTITGSNLEEGRSGANGGDGGLKGKGGNPGYIEIFNSLGKGIEVEKVMRFGSDGNGGKGGLAGAGGTAAKRLTLKCEERVPEITYVPIPVTFECFKVGEFLGPNFSKGENGKDDFNHGGFLNPQEPNAISSQQIIRRVVYYFLNKRTIFNEMDIFVHNFNNFPTNITTLIH